jgi:hypothetical protein
MPCFSTHIKLIRFWEVVPPPCAQEPLTTSSPRQIWLSPWPFPAMRTSFCWKDFQQSMYLYVWSYYSHCASDSESELYVADIWQDHTMPPARLKDWRKPPRKVLNKRTFGSPDQGQMLDMWESQTTESALRWRMRHIAPRHILELTLEVILEFTLEVILELTLEVFMCLG